MFIGRGKRTQGGTVGNLKSIRILAAVLLSIPLLAHAAGLGQLKVISGLGQPLNAEVEIVSLQPGEDDSLSARLAGAEAFRQAGVEFNPVLLGVRLNIVRRDAKSFLRLSTIQPVNEPFLELLVELQWATGRLVREYTFLLDPPEYKGPQPLAAAPPVAAPVPAPAPVAVPAPVPAPAPQPITQPITPPAPPAEAPLPRAEERPVAQPPPAAAAAAEPKMGESIEEAARRNMMGWETRWGWQGSGAAVAPEPPAVSGAATHEVQKGDTLSEIAMRNAMPGVSRNQMMIALFRANRDAFINDNINLVRAGRILALPDIDAASAVEGDEASRVVAEHMAEFGEYQRKLASAVAAAPATTTPGDRAASGPITAKPPEAAPAEQKDQLRLAKADPKKPAAGASVAAREDDSVARERALREAQSRVTELEKNVGDLRKLLELKNQQLAALEKQAGVQPGAVAPVARTPEPAVAAAPKPAPTEAPKPAPTEAPKSAAEAPKPAAEAPKPVAEAPKPKPKPRPVPPMIQETSLVDEFLDNPVALGGLGGVVALVVGYGAWAWRRKKSVQAQAGLLGATSVGAASVFNAASGPSSQTSGPQAQSEGAPAGVETDEVDPIAEADVYMAYGRDAQAEEILREALQKDPGRMPVHAKLLDIFANRRDRPAFEKTALQLRTLTGGVGPEWDKALTLGRSIDPQNALYGGMPDSTLPRFAAPGTAPSLDFDLDSVPGEAPESDIALDVAEKKETTETVDFDLGSDQAEEKSDFTPEGTLITDEKKASDGGLDFDIGGASKPGDAGIDFELPTTEGGEAPEDEKAAAADAGFDFKLDLDTGRAKEEQPRTAATQPVDLSSISLDLDAPSKPGGEPTTSTDPKWQEVATKLDLAKAYEEMGDKDGARELLNEVLKEGDAAQQSQARQMLSNLG